MKKKGHDNIQEDTRFKAKAEAIIYNENKKDSLNFIKIIIRQK